MRVKRGKLRVKKRKKLLKQTKGYRWGRKNLLKRAKEAWMKAQVHATKIVAAKKEIFAGFGRSKLTLPVVNISFPIVSLFMD